MSQVNLQGRVQKLESVLQKFSQILNRLQTLRLWFGLGVFGLLVASQMAKGLYLELIAVVILLPLFIFYLRESRKVGRFIDQLNSLKTFYTQQANFQNGLFSDSTRPEAMLDVNLARDLDLGAFFSNINYCFSEQGQSKLNHWLCQSFGDSKRQDRRSAIEKLAHYPGLLRRLQLSIPETKTDFSKIEREVKRSFYEDPISWRWLLPITWVALLLCIVLGAPAILGKFLIIAYVGLVLTFMGKTQHLFSRLQDLHSDFSGLSERIEVLEKLAPLLNLKGGLERNLASTDVKKINRLISFMSVKSNPIISAILNFLVPWDFVLAELSEKSRVGFYEDFKHWSLDVVDLEALASLANLKLYHNTQWAEVGSDFVDVKDLSHPLISQHNIVTNDFNPEAKSVIIITGSNMSGKSTFLRALGLNFCLANIGAPVFAASFKFKPMPIISCIRVSDSLRDGQSYFYAEVQRMKTILENAKKTEILFLIDEPLRGTNNRERLIGNQSYLKQILEANAKGFLSTHDLELTQLADQSDKITNYHFSEKWDEEDLKFDYKIKEGPSKSTNALKILAREGLYPQNELS